MKKLLRWSVTVLVMILVIEGLLRLFGMQPYTPFVSQTAISPSHYGVGHPTLGFALQPGTFHIQKSDSFAFSATHAADSFRTTSAVPVQEGSRKVNIYGCSITYGFGVEDEESYPWLVQKALPEHAIHNCGVSGYGLAQFFLLLQQHLNSDSPPNAVVLGYAGFQDERGTMMRNWRKSLAPAMQGEGFENIANFPYIDDCWGDSFELAYCSPYYGEWPLMQHSAFMSALENVYNMLENSIIDSHKVSWEVVRAMSNLCKVKNVPFILVGLDNEAYTSSMISYCLQNGIEAHHIGEDLTLPENTFLPVDPHPTAKVHVLYAERLIPLLEGALAE